jgi:hypothetical protein
VSRILKIEKVSTFAANREKKLANRYLSEAWSKRGRALQTYLETCFTETKTYFTLR